MLNFLRRIALKAQENNPDVIVMDQEALDKLVVNHKMN